MTRASDPFSPGALMRRHALCEDEAGGGTRGCWRAINYQVLNLNLAPQARRAASCALGLIDFCFAKSRKRDNEMESDGEREIEREQEGQRKGCRQSGGHMSGPKDLNQS